MLHRKTISLQVKSTEAKMYFVTWPLLKILYLSTVTKCMYLVTCHHWMYYVMSTPQINVIVFTRFSQPRTEQIPWVRGSDLATYVKRYFSPSLRTFNVILLCKYKTYFCTREELSFEILSKNSYYHNNIPDRKNNKINSCIMKIIIHYKLKTLNDGHL